MKKNILLLFFTLFLFSEFTATHIVGGDVHFEQTGPNTFTVTLRTYRDWCRAAVDFGASITATIRDNVTHIQAASVSLNRVSRDSIDFGDECYTPTGLCNEVIVYTGTFTLPNNPNGYYFAYSNSNRNSIITNINSSAGKVWYAQIPDPALSGWNSSPRWGPYPTDGYLCINNEKYLDLSCTDTDGDSLVYYLVQPTSSGTTKPFFMSTWIPGHNLNNILGPGGSMVIDSATGIITARPGSAGVYVFAVRCEEWRNGVKIGEVEIDLQYEALNCTYDLPPSFPPYPEVSTLNFDENGCFDVLATDPNPADTFYMVINSNAYPYGAYNTLPAPNATPAGTYTFNYIDTNTGMPASLTTAANQLDAVTFEGVGSVGARFCWQPDSCEILSIDTFKLDVLAFSKGCDGFNDTLMRTIRIEIDHSTYNPVVPNVFSPNGDGKNDEFELPIDEHDRCFDVLHVEIYNRWGLKVFESDDPLFKWDGKDMDGTILKQGTYYVLLQGYFGAKEVTNQFPVTLFR